MYKLILLPILSLMVMGCASNIHREGYNIKNLSTPLLTKENYTNQVPIKLNADLTGHESTVKGTVTMGDSGFSLKCGQDLVLAKLENEAIAVGANLINITWESYPSIISSCYRAKAQLIFISYVEWASTLKTDPQYRVGIYQN